METPNLGLDNQNDFVTKEKKTIERFHITGLKTHIIYFVFFIPYLGWQIGEWLSDADVIYEQPYR